jgi:hypothetical protein
VVHRLAHSTVLGHCQTQLHLYRLDPNPRLLTTTRRTMDFLLAKDGMAITGGDGIAYDQADWAEPRVSMADGSEPWLADMPVRDSRSGSTSALNDLKRLVLLPATAALVPDDTSVRPDGTACRIQADLDKADSSTTRTEGAFTLTLTEFPDPEGRWTYFQLADPQVAVDDALLTPAP